MDDCLFCKIVEGSVPSTAVLDTEHCYAFRDINPAAPVHVLVVPKDHLASVEDLGEARTGLLEDLFAAIRAVAAKEGIAGSGYRVVTNVGEDAGQLVHHLHFHVLGGRSLRWPPKGSEAGG
ncbi:MAG TPA: histidine triad nucleotide-binding protein [Acidimicrobiia bacterium]|nr:histidine triad nucleotide-binding protein [Acidimicrobiia bacterium]